MARFQGIDERFLVDDAAAGAVQHTRPLFHQSDFSRADQIGRFRRQRRVNRQEIDPRQQARQIRRRFDAEFAGDLINGWSGTGTATVTQIDDTWERVKVIDSLANQTERFGRVRVTMP